MLNNHEKKEKIKRLIPDEKMRDIIFNGEFDADFFLSDNNSLLEYFSNVLKLTNFIVYRAFLKWKETFNKYNSDEKCKMIATFSNSMIRLFNLYDNVYEEQKISTDFFENNILNLHIDAVLSTMSNTNFISQMKLLKFFYFENNIYKYIYELRKKRLSRRYVPEFNFDDLCFVFSMLKYLAECEITLVPSDKNKALNFLELTFNSHIYDSGSLCLDELFVELDGYYYYLDKLSFIDNKFFKNNAKKEQFINLEYVSISGDWKLGAVVQNDASEEVNAEIICLCGDTAVEDFLIQFDLFKPTKKYNDNYFFKDYIFLNNNYLKYMGLCISDAIKHETKTEIIRRYKNKYPNIFKKLAVDSFSDSAMGYRWDELIIFLLLEEGVYEFLFFVLLNKTEYKVMVASLQMRFGKRVTEIINENINDIYSHQTSRGSFSRTEIERQTNSLILLATKLFTFDELNMVKKHSPVVLVDIKNDLDKMKIDVDKSAWIKIAHVVNVILNTNEFIYIFYKALLVYIKKLSSSEAAEPERWYTDHDIYNSAINLCNIEFKKEIARLKEEMCVQDVYKVNYRSPNYVNNICQFIRGSFDKLIKLNHELSKQNSVENENLFNAIGKRKLFEDEDIEFVARSIIEGINMFGNTVSIKNNASVALNNIFDKVSSYLDYLSIGSLDESIGNLEDSIYPILSKYQSTVTSKDGYRYSYFKTIGVNSQLDAQIKAISNDDYDFAELYLCVPNINRIVTIDRASGIEHVWISPIMVPYSYYSNNSNYNISKLEYIEDYEATARLIYQTDEMIYSNLFGSEGNAVVILSYLFNDPKSVFYKGSYYILKLDDKVVAIASLYKMGVTWDANVLYSAFRDCEIDPPDTIKQAILYFEDTFRESFANNNMIADLCVSECYRNKGIAKSLLKNLIKISEEDLRDVIITVYSDNYIALNLYKSLGFIPYVSDYDNRGLDGKEEYIKLIKVL